MVRAAWLTLPLTAGSPFADALADRSDAVATVAAGLGWAAWAGVLFALLLPRPAGLVALRAAAPAALAAATWAALDTGSGAAWVAGAAVPVVLALLPETGAWLVNGTAYGDERRHLLRLPAALLAGPVVAAGLLLPVAIVLGPLLLAARAWLAGGLAVLAGAPLALLLARALHAMTTRWLVLVPAGLVVKDHLVLADPVLFRRGDVARLGPAPAGTDATDLTGGAFGLALELRLRQPTEVGLVAGRGAITASVVDALLVTPTRPGAVLADAAARRVPVG